MRKSVVQRPLAFSAVAASAISGLVVLAPGAHATQPGKDGMLALSSQYGQGTILVNPDGTGQHQYMPPSHNPVFVPNVAWSPDGSRLAILDRSGGTNGVTITDPDGSHPVTVGVHSPQAFGRLAWSADGKDVIYTDGGNQIYSVPADGSAEATPIITAATGDCLSDPSVVGNLIAYTVELQANPSVSCQGSDSVWIHDGSAGTDTKVLDNAKAADISPDGTKLVFLRTDASFWMQVYTSDVDGSNITQITTAGNHTAPIWDPEGTHIAWCGPDASGNGTGTWIRNVADGTTTNLAVSGVDIVWQPLGATAPPPPGVPAGPAGVTAVVRGSSLVVTGPGRADRVVATDATGGVAWSPNGERLVYKSSSGLTSVQADGSGSLLVTNGGDLQAGVVDPVFDADGGFVYFTAAWSGTAGYIAATPSDGVGGGAPVRVTSPATNQYDEHPNVGPDGTLLFDRVDVTATPAHTDVFRQKGTGAPVQVVANASQPVFSPDGKQIAFIRTDSRGVDQLWRVAADGVTGLKQVTDGTLGASRPSWSPDGTQLVYTLGGTSGDPAGAATQAVSVRAADGQATGSIGGGAKNAAWQPVVGRTSVVREWGADRIGTAIAASRYNFANHGAAGPLAQAGAVVLARSDQYADALAGSSLAVRKNAPLLITPTASLDPAVRAEIGRVLAPGGTVYVLGGTAALSPAVADAVASLGYHVVRLSGSDRYGTALAIDGQIDPNPKVVIVATGANFKDALAAGATGEPLVLTDGATMPAVSAGYLNRLNPASTTMVTVGGPGDKALIAGYQAGQMPSWPQQINYLPLVGATAPDSAILVAKEFTFANSQAAVATTAGWADALAGGAMIGHLGGPLLLTDPTGLYGPVASYLASENGSLWTVDMLGGPVALPTPLIGQIGAPIGYGSYDSFSAVTSMTAHPMAVPGGGAQDGKGAAPAAHSGGSAPATLNTQGPVASATVKR